MYMHGKRETPNMHCSGISDKERGQICKRAEPRVYNREGEYPTAL